MKKVLFCCFTLFVFSQSRAQVGIGTSTPNPSSVVDIFSNTKGVLFPRLSASARLNIQNPADGLLVFDADSSSLFICSSGVWARVQTSRANFYSSQSFNLEYPDNIINPIPVLETILADKSYTVPTGKNFYLQGVRNAFKVNNDSFMSVYHNRLIFKSGDIIQGIEDGNVISGFLVDSTVAPFTKNLSGTSYIVPINKFFVLFTAEPSNNANWFADLFANGMPLNPTGASKLDCGPLIFKSGTILTGSCIINGYLK